MNATVDRIANAYADVVAVEEVARGLMRVVSWSDEYYVDAAGGGCDCPDKTHNLPDGLACKHEIAAIVATTETPGPWDPDETLAGGDEDPLVMTDGGEDVPPEEVDEWLVFTHENGATQIEDSKREANERAEYVEEEFGDLTPEVFPPGEHPLLSDDEAEAVSDAAAFDPADYDDASAAIQNAPTQADAEAAMDHFNPDVDTDAAADDTDETPATAADKLDAETPEVVDPVDAASPEPASGEAVAEAAENLPERNVDEDPLDWLPGAFVDTIDGSPAINRKGFEVLGHFYDVDVTTTLEVPPEETGHEYARVKAYATIDGREVEAYGSAHVDRGDDKTLLLEMSDTRAKKRALSLATGAGAVAVEELQNEPEGGR